MSYAQYLVPAVAIQSVIFIAVLAGGRSTHDHVRGLRDRLATLPFAAAVPMGTRMPCPH